MKRLALSLLIATAATTASAQPRASTVNMSCGQARRIVATHGAAVLGTGGYTYDRFVADRRFCQPTETTEPAWVPAGDTPQCFVGYRCKEIEMPWDW